MSKSEYPCCDNCKWSAKCGYTDLLYCNLMLFWECDHSFVNVDDVCLCYKSKDDIVFL